MIAIIGLEERGAVLPRSAPRLLRKSKQRTPWVARIVGSDSQYGLARQFIEGKRDYRDASSSGRTGVKLYFTLYEGYYEVNEIVNATKERRYFVRSRGGKVEEVAKSEVEEWVKETEAAAKVWLQKRGAT